MNICLITIISFIAAINSVAYSEEKGDEIFLIGPTGVVVRCNIVQGSDPIIPNRRLEKKFRSSNGLSVDKIKDELKQHNYYLACDLDNSESSTAFVTEDGYFFKMLSSKAFDDAMKRIQAFPYFEQDSLDWFKGWVHQNVIIAKEIAGDYNDLYARSNYFSIAVIAAFGLFALIIICVIISCCKKCITLNNYKYSVNKRKGGYTGAMTSDPTTKL